MKRKNFIQSGFILLALVGITLFGCKKKSNDDVNTDTSTLNQVSKDENTMSNASDDAMNDASSVSEAKSTEGVPCDATVTNSVSGDTIIRTIEYSGVACPLHPLRIRSGKIIVKKLSGIDWSQPGKTIWVKFDNFKVKKNAKSVTINGTKSFKNVTGGVLSSLTGTGSITHEVTGSVSVLLDNETTPRSWNIARRRTFTGTFPNALILTVEGFGTSSDGNYTKLVTWGTNRSGENFYTQITSSVVHSQACDWDPISGQKVFQIPADSKKATITFGYNSNNVLVTGTDCPTQCKVDWEKNGHTGTAYIGI